jgi:AcrR family transcriptional regulator
VGVSPADRRIERRALLLDAAFELLGTDGSSATTVRSVCAGARLNPRYFYESFTDLDALVVAVYDRVVEQLTEAVVSTMDVAPGDSRSQTRAAIEQIVGFVDEDRRRGRVLYAEALDNEALNRRRVETGHALAEIVALDAAKRFGAPPPGEQIGRVGATILVGGFSELLIAWLDGRIDLTREQLVDDATALFSALGETAAAIASRRSRRSSSSERAGAEEGAP